jgi:gas vesicle protein
MNTAGKVMVGVLAGAAAGLITGILIAPDSGRHTREKIAGKARDLKDKVRGSFGGMKHAYNKKVETFAGEGKAGIDYLKDNLKV